ncbi:MAG: nucleotidyltransferase family protein [Pseudoruegeria sp.]
MTDLTLFMPAAGRSSRMRGTDKLMTEIDGVPLLRRQVLRAIDSEIPVVVTVPDLDHPRAKSLADLKATILAVPDFADGMTASFRRIYEAFGAISLMVALPDMPDIRTSDFHQLAESYNKAPEWIHRATAEDGTPGHPTVFPDWATQAFHTLKGDTGAKPILRAHPDRIKYHALDGKRALTDLDTPEAFAHWTCHRPEN